MMDDPNDYANPTRCPYCGKQNDAATNVNGAGAPDDGDVSFCIDCGRFGFFASNAPGGMRKATIQEATKLATDRDCYCLRFAWEQTMRHVGGRP